MQDDVSVAIAHSLLQALSAREVLDIKTKRPGNTEAYETFLKASYLGFRFDHVPTLENYRNAETMFKRAIELDPEYAPSHAGLAYLYNNCIAYIAKTEEEKQKYLQLMKSEKDMKP